MVSGYQAFLIWALLGFISGFITSKAIHRNGKHLLPDVLLGMLGGVLGGSVFAIAGMKATSLSVAPGAGVLTVATFQTLRRRWLYQSIKGAADLPHTGKAIPRSFGRQD